MDITDLMIGDLVSILTIEVIRITDIKDGIIYGKSIDGLGLYQTSIKNIRPILITSKILEKNFGKKRAKGGFFYHFMGKYLHGCEYILEYRTNDYFAFCREHGGLLCNISFVHELQHALKLCGIKKKIIL